MKESVAIFWFRRDLRLNDNTALFYALQSNIPVLPIFIFDKNILEQLDDKEDKRIVFIHSQLLKIQQQLTNLGSSLLVLHDTPINAFASLSKKITIAKVYTNSDYELYAMQRDKEIKNFLLQQNIPFYNFKDHVVFEKNEVLKEDAKPYTIFTPYSKKWKATLQAKDYQSFNTEKYYHNFYQTKSFPIPSLQDIGFTDIDNISFPLQEISDNVIAKYDSLRDFPAIDATSKLSVHLRFGTISIRQLVKKAIALNEVFLNELIWRDFYHMIIFHFTHVQQGLSFKKEYDFIEWRNNEQDFDKWCKGQTGYPIVDAGMRELNATGFMHNRVRMIVASFLTKHLLIDWRWGESYFAKKLLDYDFAANNGGWQWAASCGCDAVPYFRIFNPTTQTQKFDKDLLYIKKWVPEINSFQYAKPIVEHDFARKRALEVYGKTLSKNKPT